MNERAMGSPGDGSRWTALLPAAVMVALLLASAAAFVGTRRLVSEQNDRLLDQRGEELTLLLTNSITGMETALRVLASVAATSTPDGSESFTESAERLVDDGSSRVFAVRDGGEGPRVLAGTGGRESGDVSGEIAALFERALGADEQLVAARVGDGDDVRLLMAVGVDDTVVIQESTIAPEAPPPSDGDSPYRDLRVALYAATRPDPAQLILSTESTVPLTGDVRREPFQVGADRWLLSVAAREPLSGAFANQAPWLLLVAGLTATALATAVTTTLARRRSYAMALVSTRTADLRRAQEAAEQANHSKSEFLSRMSHELRTPLNAVLGFGQVLEMDDDLSSEQRDAVDHILKGGKHLLELINEVLDISRVETGNISLSPEAVLVGDLLSDAVDLIRPLADQRGIQLAADRSGAWDSYVLADRQRSKQVLLNLLSNAVKYNRQRGTVAVSCEVSDGRCVRILVTDTGPGIRPEQLDLVFLPFERLGAEQSEVEGTGIGLALSKHLAEAMSGKLGVDSTPGVGSTFWVELPLVEGPVERYDRLNGGATPSPVTVPVERRNTVLHIEDNLSNVKLVERILAQQRPDIEVVAAMQGRLGLELAHEHRPLLVLLDLHLPDMSGEQVLQRLRDDPITASTPVVIVSADATPGQVQRLVAAGAAAYLTKPIDVRELLRILDDSLSDR